MAFVGRFSTPEDRDQITSLMIRSMGIGEDHPAICPDMQRWKYWPPSGSGRSQVLLDGETVVAHGAIWPIRLRGPFGELPAFHLIDWAAQRSAVGAGMQILRQCTQNASAVFSIGGSAMTRKILPAFGFSPQNRIAFLTLPLHPLQPAWEDSERDWKLPARLLRNLKRFLVQSRAALPAGWSFSATEVEAIPEVLFPGAGPGEAVSVRDAALLRHMMACPRILNWRSYTLLYGPVVRAYFCLAQVKDRLRVVDFGPAALDETTCGALVSAIRQAVSRDFTGCVELIIATTEPAVEAAFASAGFHIQRAECIKVLKIDPVLKTIGRYRLTLLDWDALCG
jgi:hypothetical protein